MYFRYNYSLWIYLSWFPTYLLEARGFNFKQMGFWHMVPLIAATIGDTAGGWLSDHLVRPGRNLRFARRAVAITGFALASACILPATLTEDRYLSVAFTTGALFFLELTVGVSWAVAMDVGPEYAGSVSGVMNMRGNIGGMLASVAIGYMAQFINWTAGRESHVLTVTQILLANSLIPERQRRGMFIECVARYGAELRRSDI